MVMETAVVCLSMFEVVFWFRYVVGDKEVANIIKVVRLLLILDINISEIFKLVHVVPLFQPSR